MIIHLFERERPRMQCDHGSAVNALGVRCVNEAAYVGRTGQRFAKHSNYWCRHHRANHEIDKPYFPNIDNGYVPPVNSDNGDARAVQVQAA